MPLLLCLRFRSTNPVVQMKAIILISREVIRTYSCTSPSSAQTRNWWTCPEYDANCFVLPQQFVSKVMWFWFFYLPVSHPDFDEVFLYSFSFWAPERIEFVVVLWGC